MSASRRVSLICSLSILALAGAGVAQSEVVFRYKSGLVPSKASLDCTANPLADGCSDGDTEDAPLVKIEGDPNTVSDAPTPLALTLTDSDTDPGGDRIVYQCVSASGGYGNYLWSTYPWSSASWIESYDLVLKTELSSPMPKPGALYDNELYAPVMDAANARFALDSGAEACLRVKVAQDAAGGYSSDLYIGISDYDPSLVVDGYVDEADLNKDTSYGSVSFTFELNPEEVVPPPAHANSVMFGEFENISGSIVFTPTIKDENLAGDGIAYQCFNVTGGGDLFTYYADTWYDLRDWLTVEDRTDPGSMETREEYMWDLVRPSELGTQIGRYVLYEGAGFRYRGEILPEGWGEESGYVLSRDVCLRFQVDPNKGSYPKTSVYLTTSNYGSGDIVGPGNGLADGQVDGDATPETAGINFTITAVE